MDFNALRAQTLGSGADEEAVTVNTRALIDKVLARYSGEWTTLRELIQNAADASATKVTIKFETIPSATVALPHDASKSNMLKHVVQNHSLKRMVVTNNGQVFNENDWNRLKRIAEGNPDETKIGAFGVGFYSTFADCEEPFVSSGREAMAFFWKTNALFTRRLRLPEGQGNNDTNFVLDYRDTTSSIPSLISISQFLASSLTFVGIEKIELWIDQWNILTLNKKVSPRIDVPIPKDVEPKTSEGFMKITKVSKELAQIDASWMPIVALKAPHSAKTNHREDAAPSLRGFFSRLAGGRPAEETNAASRQTETENLDLTQKVSATIFLNVDTAEIKTYTGQKFNEELERATKKPPPKTTRLAVLTAPFVENDSISATAKYGDVFGTVLPSRSGRIFIGFPTHQTTGLNAHISAPSVIPTVERESIDLNAKWVRTWNMEMLRAAGIVCRIVWTSEMGELRTRIYNQSNGAKNIRIDHVLPFLQEGITISKNFTFKESTPSPKTGELLEDAFWRSGKKASIDVLSSCGVLPTHQVRIAPKDLSFVEGVPVLPEKLVEEAKPFVNKLVEYGLVTEVTVSDIREALESNPLTSKQLSEFMEWLVKNAAKEQLDSQTISRLLSTTVANEDQIDGASSGRLLMLGGIEYFHNPSRIPPNLPVPDTVMPLKYTSGFSKKDLESLGWQELQLVPWMRWLISESSNRAVLREDQDLTSSAAFSTQVFALLSKQWDSMSQSSKQTLIELLSANTVVPTRFGMKKPGDAYFSNVKLFDDLPTITGFHNVKDKILTACGVRKTVELGVVFDRLLRRKDEASTNPSRHMALVQYLASVRDDIPAADMQRLRNTPICPKEDRQAQTRESSERYKVSELFEPRPQLRDLDLPVLAWSGPYRSSSAEGRLLTSLGLRTTPDVTELVSIMARCGNSGETQLRDTAMAYFISGYHANSYGQFDFSKIQTPFLPLENKPNELSTPSRCYADEGATLLGFDLLRKDLHSHAPMFGVRRHPPIETCIQILATRKLTSHSEARSIFTYFAGRLNEVTASILPKLQDLNFVPIFAKSKEKPVVKSYTSPRNVFLGDSDTFGEIFNYVDFGQEANAFLLKCGSKPEPTKVEVAQILVREPARISSTFKNPEKYLTLLRSLADSVSVLKKNKDLFREMKKAPFLLASKHILGPPKNGKLIPDDDDLEDEESQGIMEWQLCSAEDAIIVDEFIAFNLFKTNILAAPQEEGLEDFYYALGSQMLSSLVEEAAKHGPRAADQSPASKLHKLIVERSQLFLHEQPLDTIKHDSRWLDKKLNVQLVSNITLRRSLKGRNITHSAKRTAVVTHTNGEYTLWVVSANPDFYQVSQALIHLLLNRPKLHSPLTLEMLLKTDLLDLRNRGFNVSRILRQKAAEARLAENQRQQELEEEQRRISEQQKVWETSQTQRQKGKVSKPQMIGAFPDSPDGGKNALSGPAQFPPDTNMDNEPLKQAQRLFSNFTRGLGLGGRQQRPQSIQQDLPNRSRGSSEMDPPPPYSQSGPSGLDQAVTAPHHMRENLLSAIRKTRPHNSSEIFSRGEQNKVSETKSYCDEKPGHDLQFVAELKHSIQMFLPQEEVSRSSQFLQQNIKGLTRFADLLKSTGEVFSLSPRILNIFFETGGKTIAFNRNGSIFCNYLYFKQLHESQILGGDLEQAEAACNDALVYWWVILCHELAHNLVADHSSNHSYYTEGFVAQYFGRVVDKIAEGKARVRQGMASGTEPRPS